MIVTKRINKASKIFLNPLIIQSIWLKKLREWGTSKLASKRKNRFTLRESISHVKKTTFSKKIIAKIIYAKTVKVFRVYIGKKYQ
jgi:hypothetical protein